MKILKGKRDRRKRVRIPIAVKIFLGFVLALVFMLLSNFLILWRVRTLGNIVGETGHAVNRAAQERAIIDRIEKLRKEYAAYETARSQINLKKEDREFIEDAPKLIIKEIAYMRALLDTLDIGVRDSAEKIYFALDSMEIVFGRDDGPLVAERAYMRLLSSVQHLLLAEQQKADSLVHRSRGITKTSARYGILLSLGMLLLSAVTAVFIAKLISRPIAQLRQATHYARLGKYNRRVSFTSHDEIADLTADFNAMMSALGKLEKMKAMFLASITHDLKSPLYRVKLGLENLQDEIHGDLSKEQRHAIENLLDDVDTLSRLIHDILDIQKMESGRFKLNLSDVGLSRFIRETVKKHAISFSQKGVGLLLRIDIADNASARIDRKQIERVFENLLSNALKFAPKSGMVTVTASHRKHTAHVSIHDTGPGIPEGELNKIFDKFYRVGPGTDIRGTGLGLTIARQIILAHNGRIWVESKLGEGATFSFVIPAATHIQKRKQTAGSSGEYAMETGEKPDYTGTENKKGKTSRAAKKTNIDKNGGKNSR